jgi:hypothetical protein
MRIGVTGAIRRVCRASGASSLPYGGHYGIDTDRGGRLPAPVERSPRLIMDEKRDIMEQKTTSRVWEGLYLYYTTM